MTWTDYRKSLNISIYLTSLPKADLISLDPTSFCVPQGQQATEVKVMVAPEEAMYHGPGASARNNELGHTWKRRALEDYVYYGWCIEVDK